MFFAKPGEYEPTGLYTVGHLILFIIAIIGIAIALKFTWNKKDENVTKIIKITTTIMWILEIIKIIFNLAIGNNNPNNYIPLYFCSIILYAGIFSGFCKGWLKHVGDVFLATGGLVGGVAFLICPTTSLGMYPIFHYISLQSIFLHATMVYLGILVNVSNYIKITGKDIIEYAGLMVFISLIAYVYNIFYDSNLMFISKDFPGTPIHILYSLSGKWFTFWAVTIQSTVPFYIMFGIIKFSAKVGKKIQNFQKV